MPEKKSRSIDDLRREFDDSLRSFVDLKTKLSSSVLDARCVGDSLAECLNVAPLDDRSLA